MLNDMLTGFALAAQPSNQRSRSADPPRVSGHFWWKDVELMNSVISVLQLSNLA
jgi:hypothetical protein